jgi:histidinol-phosphate/aromatic aminotransferase/cobyric acid decarboxylase-like protein
MAERWGHGDPDLRELRALGLDDPRALLDFAVNVSPLGADPAVLAAIREAPLDRYPDPTGLVAREALATHLGVAPERIALGNGAAELLWTLVRALDGRALQSNRSRCANAPLHVVIAEPTFSELRVAAERAGAEVRRVWASPERGYRLDPDALAEAARGADLLYVCNPNNPTGHALPHTAIEALCAALPSTSVVIDQAFLSLSERHEDAARPLPDNAFVLRSLTKDHALPGLRVAYGLGAPALVAGIEASRPPWTTSAPAQAAVVASTRSNHVARVRPRLLADRRALEELLARLGLHTFESQSLFVLAEVGDAAALRRRLLTRHGVAVRDCASFGLPRCVRLCARPPEDLARLEAALRAELR